MKFGDKFSQYVQRSCFRKEGFHLEYERLKALLKDFQHNRQSEVDSCDEYISLATSVSSSEPCPVFEEICLSEVTLKLSVASLHLLDVCFAPISFQVLEDIYGGEDIQVC